MHLLFFRYLNKSLLIVLLGIVAIGCHTSKKQQLIRQSYYSRNSPLELSLIEAKYEIEDYLKKKGMFIDSLGIILNGLAFNNRKIAKPCVIVKEFLEGNPSIVLNTKVSVNLVDAMFIDSNNNYIFNFSITTYITKPSDYALISKDLELIDIAEKSDYYAYIQFFNCNDIYFFGLSKSKIDLLKYSGNKLVLIKSIPLLNNISRGIQ